MSGRKRVSPVRYILSGTLRTSDAHPLTTHLGRRRQRRRPAPPPPLPTTPRHGATQVHRLIRPTADRTLRTLAGKGPRPTSPALALPLEECVLGRMTYTTTAQTPRPLSSIPTLDSFPSFPGHTASQTIVDARETKRPSLPSFQPMLHQRPASIHPCTALPASPPSINNLNCHPYLF